MRLIVWNWAGPSRAKGVPDRFRLHLQKADIGAGNGGFPGDREAGEVVALE
jgi:hypothetical protein